MTVSNKNSVLTGILIIAVLGQSSSTLFYFGQTYNLQNTLQLRTHLNTPRMMDIVAVFTDTLIAAVLIALLLKHRSGFRKTNSIVHRLAVYTLGTGLVTGLWIIVGLIGSVVVPDTFFYLLIQLVVSRRE